MADSIVTPQIVALAQKLADAAGPILRRYFRSPIGVDDKPDLSPVTIADREAGHARPQRRDLARRLQSRDHDAVRAGPRGIGALALGEIGPVESGRAGPEQDLSRPGSGIGHGPPAQRAAAERVAWTQAALVLLNSNEFVYVH